MSALVVDNLESGDGRRVLATITEEGTSNPAPRSDNRSPAKQELPARFKGKSTEELVEMYQNLETHSGRLANNLGQTQQQLTEALAIAKRNSDLSQNSPTVASPEVNAVDLLANPTKALEQILEKRVREETNDLRSKLSTLEAQLQKSQFERNHSDSLAIFQDPNWANFVGATPLRQALLARAQQGDFQAGDTLLTEFKASRVVTKREETQTNSREAAKHVSLETGTASGGDDGSSRPAGKIYKRGDIIRLMQTNPDEYYSDAVQATLMKARLDGRIVD